MSDAKYIFKYLEGSELCKQNTLSLIRDAKLLLSKGSIGHGGFFVIAANEEYYKRIVYYLMALLNHYDIVSSNIEKTLKRHEFKVLSVQIVPAVVKVINDIYNKYWVRNKLQKNMLITLEKEISNRYHSFYDKTQSNDAQYIIKSIRELSLYVDWSKGLGLWTYPLENDNARIDDINRLIDDLEKSVDAFERDIKNKPFQL